MYNCCIEKVYTVIIIIPFEKDFHIFVIFWWQFSTKKNAVAVPKTKTITISLIVLLPPFKLQNITNNNHIYMDIPLLFE